MRIFILEDDPKRIVTFQQELIGHEVTVATGVEEGLEKFDPPYDLYLLDHDLGGEVYVPSDAFNTGATFLRQAAVHRVMKDAVVVVHSFNYAGGKEMEKLAKEAGAAAIRVPFGPALFQIVEALAKREVQVEEHQS